MMERARREQDGSTAPPFKFVVVNKEEGDDVS
jgi:hypothetical protein